MKVKLELFTARPAKDGSYPLTIRFSINRKAYRYLTGVNLTPVEWASEIRNGYRKSFTAVQLQQKAISLLKDADPHSFNMNEFRVLMGDAFAHKDSVTRLFDEYLEKRKNGKLAIRTRELDDCSKKKLKEFFVIQPDYNNIHTWDKDRLNEFYDFMIEEGESGGNVSVATAGIYLRIFSAFFNWLIDEKEMLSKSPFRKYTIPRYQNNHFPYTDTELGIILSVEPSTPKQEAALNWTKMMLYSGGTDMKDFAGMRWKQVHSEAIQMIRTKAKNSSGSAHKVLHLLEEMKLVFDHLKSHPKGKQDDYVFDIYKKDKSDNQNLEFLKAKMNSINDSMNEMLKDKGIHFMIKRLRPSAATIANNSTNDVNYVKMMLMHSNIKQTDTYLKRTPDDKNKQNQVRYTEAIKKLTIKKPEPT